MKTIENKEFIYEFGRFALDPRERILTAGGKPVHLPAKEFETLLFLVEHNGHAVSKEEMVSAIWQDAYVEESNLAKQISRLRKILNKKGEQFIETIPKHGYRFSAELRLIEPSDDTAIIVEKRTVKRLTVDYEDEPEQLSMRPARQTAVLKWAACAIVVLAAASWLWFRRPATASPQGIKTIAVLPLRPLNDDEDGRAIGLGLSDALITQLGQLKRVTVRPMNAVASMPAGADPTELGRRLNVDAVLEGTIQQADGHLRVNARLLGAANGEQIWGDRFEEPIEGIFALQDALSTNIAKALAFELNKADSDQLVRRGTQNKEAYEKYLRGRFYESQNTADGLARSIELYEQSAALDPNFAEAYAGIADANILLFNFSVLPKSATIPKAKAALERALRLNPGLSDTHTSNALIQFLVDQNWPEAEKSLQLAIQLNPNNSDAFIRYGYFLINVGRFDDALVKLERARELNPLAPIVSTDIGLAYLCSRRYPEAIAQLQKTAAENPRFSLPHWLLGAAYEATGDNENAFEENLRALVTEDGVDNRVYRDLQKVRDEKGTAAANRWWFEATVKSQKTQTAASLLAASRAATINDRNQTLSWLEKASLDGDAALSQIKYLAKYDFVRDDPRFKAIVDTLAY